MNVLIIKNVKNEGPGTIEDFLKEQGAEYSVVDFSGCSATEKSVPDISKFSHLVIMGGPMALYESEGAPLVHFETAMIRAFMLHKKPVLGICLGAQLIAHALKSHVYAGGTEEVGWNRVEINPEGMKDPVLSTIAVNNEPFTEVFQWHGDTFDLPKKTVRLASSKAYKNQAFKYKDNVYALQFHIEVRPEMIREWFADKKACDTEKMFEQTDDIYPEYRKRAMKFYGAFFK